jgi:iron complex transport system substrate-binding protein
MNLAVMRLDILCWTVPVAIALMLAAFPPRAGHLPAATPHGPKRVAIYPPVAAAYATLGNASDLSAASLPERQMIAAGALGAIFPPLRHLQSLATVGGRSAIPSDPEQLLLLAPSNIIVWAWATGGLEALGFPSEEISSTETASLWKRIGVIAQGPGNTEIYLATFTQSIRKISEAIARAEPQQGRRVLILWRTDLADWRLATAANLQMRYLLQTGAARPLVAMHRRQVGAGSLPVDKEAILELATAVIFLACCAPVDDTPQTLYADPALQSLKAVRERRVYKQPAGAARMDGLVEWPLLLRWYAELLFPDRLPQTFRDDFKRAYRDAYHYSVSDRELDDMIFMNENRSSAGYLRFAGAPQ